MLSVLINAYACSPGMGSEPGMAWNWCVNLANYCKLHIITEGEFKDKIEAALPTLPQGKNMQFYYNPVPDNIRKMCWNQGDWRFYRHYKQWQRKTYLLALDIVQQQKIDVIHQLNMIGFREPGYLWKIKDIPFVWGPVGGLMDIPTNYISSGDVKKALFVRLKSILNKFQIKYHFRVKKALQCASVIIGATGESVAKIEKHYQRKVILMNETGCYVKESLFTRPTSSDDNFHIVWVGRFLFSKKLDLALKTIAKLKPLGKIKFHIVGEGSSHESQYYKQLSINLGIQEICIWHGSVPHMKVQIIMQKSDILFFTSIAEGTPHVVLEAISNHLPVVCFDCCGQGDSVNEAIGIKIKLSDPEQSINEFAEKIEHLFRNRTELYEMSDNCAKRQQELSWENKAKQMIAIYHQTANRPHNN